MGFTEPQAVEFRRTDRMGCLRQVGGMGTGTGNSESEIEGETVNGNQG